MYLAPLGNGLVYEFLQLCHWCRVLNSALCCHVGYAVNAAEPNDVLDIDVVADEPFLVLVGVNHTHQAFTVLAEVVQERTVLTETVCIGRVVDGRQVVAHQYD